MDSNIAKFMSLMRGDAGIREALKDKSMGDIVAFAKEHGFDISEKELLDAIEDERQNMSDNDLEQVAGGCGGCGRTCENDNAKKTCPKCGGVAEFVREDKWNAYYQCTSCGHKFDYTE